MQKNVIILGARGKFGSAAAGAFEAAGWNVTRLARSRADRPSWICADASDVGALSHACAGQAVIVNALNPPYHEWMARLPGLTRAVIAAAKASGATILIPGNVYNYGEELPELLGQDTPHRAAGKGALRIEMEAAYRAAGVRTIVLRGGDFIDGGTTGAWFDGVIAANAAKGRLVYPGPTDRVHAWAYLPDMARAAVALCERAEDLPRFADIPFAGYALTGEALLAAIDKARGKTHRRGWFPRPALAVLGIFSPMMREVREMLYLWDRPHRLDPAPLQRLLPSFRATPLDQALKAVLPA